MEEKTNVKIVQIVPASNVMVYYANAHEDMRYEVLQVELWALMSDGSVIGLEIHRGRLKPVNEKSALFIGYTGLDMTGEFIAERAEELLKAHEIAVKK